MSTKRRMLALLLLLLTVGAGPAWAVSFAYRDQARSEGGDVRVDLTPTSTTFCILSQFTVRDHRHLRGTGLVFDRGRCC
jgi:hypothetical protein